jgi:nucleotide-binding universal stress UspA family protein
MTAYPTLLVPLSGSSSALAALPVARRLAEVMHATVTLIHVGPEELPPGELLKHLNLSPDDVRGLIIVQRSGSPANAIVEAAVARHAILIVMGAPARLDEPQSLFRSVPGEVLRIASCPVVLVPHNSGQRPWALRQLVLPHDGTPISAAAIAPTADLAARIGADLVVLHVATAGAERPSEPGTFYAPRYLDQPHHEWPIWAQEFLERVRCACHPVRIEKIRLVLTQGETSAAILEFARSNASDLIALAWRGAYEPERARTIRRVVGGASCPVIIFRVQP